MFRTATGKTKTVVAKTATTFDKPSEEELQGKGNTHAKGPTTKEKYNAADEGLNK